MQMLAVSAAAAAAERPASHTEGTCACPKCHMGRSTRGPFLGAEFSALLGSQCWPTNPAVLQGLLGCWLVLARGWLLCHRLLRVLPAQFGGGAGACGATLSCTGTPWHGGGMVHAAPSYLRSLPPPRHHRQFAARRGPPSRLSPNALWPRCVASRQGSASCSVLPRPAGCIGASQ